MTLIELRKLAEATTEGSWYTELNIAPRIGSSVDAAYIAAANPAAVLSLLDQIESLQAENERLKVESTNKNDWYVEWQKCAAERDAFAAKLANLEADAERLNWIESKTYPSITIFKHFKGYEGYAFRFDDKSIGFEGSIRQAIDAAKGGQQ